MQVVVHMTQVMMLNGLRLPLHPRLQVPSVGLKR
jgi:hypothetical protein